jgi:1-acyl-sn-glycerol-3-phosphate acyltransferase
MAALRSLLFMALFYGGSFFIVLVSPAFAALGRRRFTRWVYVWMRWHRWCARWLLGIRYRVEGRLPDGPVLVAMKHEAMYETLIAFLLLDRPAPVYKRELEKIPIWGYVTKVYGSLIVDRDGGAKAMRQLLAEGRALTAEGRPILIYPEGTRIPHGQRPPVKPGVAGLYRILGLPVVTVAVDSGRLIPRGSWIKRPGTVTFRVGEAIPPGLSREEIEQRVWEGINALNG